MWEFSGRVGIIAGATAEAVIIVIMVDAELVNGVKADAAAHEKIIYNLVLQEFLYLQELLYAQMKTLEVNQISFQMDGRLNNRAGVAIQCCLKLF